MPTVIIDDDLDAADFYEVQYGQIVRISPMSEYAAEVANRLNTAAIEFLFRNDFGETAIGRRFQIAYPGDPNRRRRPRWSYVSYERFAKNRPIPFDSDACDSVPDIVAEVVSPDDKADELIAKAREYLLGGVRLVWIVYPLVQEIHAYLPGANHVRAYFANHELEAPDILPGFRTPVDSLFPPVEVPPLIANET